MKYADVLEDMQAEVLECNIANGWFDEDRTVGDDIALITTEVGEAFDAFRVWGLEDATTGDKPEGFGSEIADILIRLLDTCYRRNVNLGYEFDRKMAYNRTRGYKHGNKRI